MTVGAALILYAGVVGALGPAGFRRSGWLVRAPRLGAAAVLAAAWSVLFALLLAGLTLLLPASALTTDIGSLVGACLTRLRAAYGSPGGAGVVVLGQALTTGLAARMVFVAGRLTLHRRTERHRHRLLIRLAGHRLAQAPMPIVVLDAPGVAAYSLAGRRPTVVVTSGAMEVLTAGQLSAVLAHEQAHLQARHHRWQLAAALAAATLPFVPLLRETPARLGRLLEMDADERSLRLQEPRILASALVAVGSGGASAGSSSRRQGAGMTAAGADAVARIHRLLRPPDRLPFRGRTLARSAVVAVSAGPLLLATAPALLALR
jgi:Zn-dependent protease with chaperone function